MTKKHGKKCLLAPRLRFPEFQNAGEWKDISLNEIAIPVTDRATNGGNDTVLTLSAEYGVVAQDVYFDKKIAGNDVKRYIKIIINDFVYNDRTTKSYKYGTIKRLSTHNFGIVSPIYKCFRFNPEEIPVFWECYFESGVHTPQLHKIINEGAKEGRFNISIQQFLSTVGYRPDRLEQQRIADCLSSLDERIAAENSKLDRLKDHKKGLLKQLFPAEGKTLPQLRFPEFRDTGEWGIQQLGEKIDLLTGYPFNGVDISEIPKGNKLLRGINVTEGFVRHSQEIDRYYNNSCDSLKKFKLKVGDLVIGMDGSKVGKNSAIISDKEAESLLVQRVARLRTKCKTLTTFIFHHINSEMFHLYVDKINTSSGIPHISAKQIRDFEIAFPSMPEQQKIADCLSSLDKLITAQTQKIDLLKEHKKGLMQQLFPHIDEVLA